jgi:hypothetical protein
MRVAAVEVFIVVAASLLAACAVSETRSVVSTADIPAAKYARVAVFIENLDEAERPIAEGLVVSALKGAGVDAVSGNNFLKRRDPNLTETAKALLVQKEFDALLYVKVVDKGVSEERIEQAWFDGKMVHYNIGILTVANNVTDPYVIKPDGSVYRAMLVLKTQSELQDTKSAKVVWSGETVSSGYAKASNMTLLFDQASKQIIEKMRTDSAV